MNKYLVWLFLAMLSVTNVEYAFGTPSFDDDDPAPEQANLYHCNAYGGAARVYASGRDGAGDNAAFVIEYDNLPQEACIGLATSDWSSSLGSGFIAMAVNGDVG